MINQSYESAKSDPADLTIDAFSASSGREKGGIFSLFVLKSVFLNKLYTGTLLLFTTYVAYIINQRVDTYMIKCPQVNEEGFGHSLHIPNGHINPVGVQAALLSS